MSIVIFELIKYEDTLPGLHTEFPQTIVKYTRNDLYSKRLTILQLIWITLKGTRPTASTD